MTEFKHTTPANLRVLKNLSKASYKKKVLRHPFPYAAGLHIWMNLYMHKNGKLELSEISALERRNVKFSGMITRIEI